MWIQSLSQEDPLEKGMATHSSILACRIPWIEEPGLQSIGSQRVGHDWSDLASTHERINSPLRGRERDLSLGMHQGKLCEHISSSSLFRTDLTHTLSLNFRLWENKFLLSKPPSLLHFVWTTNNPNFWCFSLVSQ